MSVLVFIDQSEGIVSKSSHEAASYGAAIAAKMGTQADGIVLGNTTEDLSALGSHGLKIIHTVADAALNALDAHVYTDVLAQAAASYDVIVFSNNSTAKAVGPRLSVKLKAGLVAGAIELPDTTDGFVVKKSVFSGKAFAHVKIETEKKIISLNVNSVSVTHSDATATVTPFAANVPTGKVTTVSLNKVKGEISLSEADKVVSGGRGLKGPENWGMIEELASLLGAATACSRPVSDIDWRPHHEHVGQTGLAIAPNLYIAIGISGAIQHLAGVNRSKTIVVINSDAEAPFFKAADYGIVGDAFEVVPKIIDAVKKLKGVA